jgi:hypothetical protein
LARIERVSPTRKALADALGPFKTCREPTHVQNPDGTDTVKITHEDATPQENSQRFGVYVEITADRRELEIERSQRRNAEHGEVVFHDVRTGEVRAVDPAHENRIARTKRWARPGARRRTFIGFGRARV